MTSEGAVGSQGAETWAHFSSPKTQLWALTLTDVSPHPAWPLPAYPAPLGS